MKNTIKKRAALYDPYIDVMGGGERHILSILKILENYGYEITIFWDKDISNSLKERLNISFHTLTLKPNIVGESFISRNKTLSKYDIFFYVTDGSYFYSPSAKNVIYCMVPDKKLYKRNILNRFKTHNVLFITHSQYTSTWLNAWGIPNKIIYPYISKNFLHSRRQNRSRTILMVGRFFTHLHAKRQDVAIVWFQKLKKQYPIFTKYKLILAGSVKQEDTVYFQSLQNMVHNDASITFKPNISFTKLLSLYQSSQFYWHFTGYGVDANAHPENVEHLGITPLEAMATGCITCAYAAGGPKEIITQGENGILFTTQNALFLKMSSLLKTPQQMDKMKKKAYEYVLHNFSYNTFQKRVVDILNP